MIKLLRNKNNPILKPDSKHWWEAKSVFNPGVVYDGKDIHMLYRALGGDRISRFGYAYSKDGANFKGRKEFPIFESDPSDLYERMGCEDPRITKIEDTYYITYCAASLHPATYPKSQFATAAAPWRVRVSMLSTKDFETFTRHGIIIPDVDSKDAVLFPEKINGQYVILHRIWPDIWMAFSKDLKEWYDQRSIIKPRKNSWDSSKIGAGTNLIKSEIGWIEFYHGIDEKNVYRIGIVIFDLNDPTKIIYRSKDPVLSPEEDYEKNGFVNNVVFASGAIEKGENILVYYGAADRSIGVATVNKNELIKQISSEI